MDELAFKRLFVGLIRLLGLSCSGSGLVCVSTWELVTQYTYRRWIQSKWQQYI